MSSVSPLAPRQGDTWVALSDLPLPLSAVAAWVGAPSCGATVTFTGTTRDHSPGRPGVTRLEYEAYEAPAELAIERVVEQARRRWPEVVRVAALHRVGTVALGEAAVVVSVCAPHRPEAFEAASFVVDELKRTAPIWKLETWDGGKSWGKGCEQHHSSPRALGSDPLAGAAS